MSDNPWDWTERFADLADSMPEDRLERAEAAAFRALIGHDIPKLLKERDEALASVERLTRDNDFLNGRIARMEGDREIEIDKRVRARLSTELYDKNQEIQRLTNAVASWQHEVKLRDEQIENYNADRDTYD